MPSYFWIKSQFETVRCVYGQDLQYAHPHIRWCAADNWTLLGLFTYVPNFDRQRSNTHIGVIVFCTHVVNTSIFLISIFKTQTYKRNLTSNFVLLYTENTASK